MDGVLGQPEAQQQRLDTQNLLESADDGNRPARIERQGLAAESIGDGALGSLVSGHVGRGHIGHAAVQEPDGDFDALGRDAAEMGLEEFAYLPEILVRNQPHRNLGRGFRGNHRLGSLAGITSPNAVDVERRTDSGAFEGGEPGFALDVADTERTLVGGQAERRLVESPALGGRELADIVVEARSEERRVGKECRL